MFRTNGLHIRRVHASDACGSSVLLLHPSLVAAISAGSISPLAPLAYSLTDAAAGLRQLSGARAIGKVVTTAPSAPGGPAQEAGAGRWIITGGLGALGLLSARCRPGIAAVLQSARAN